MGDINADKIVAQIDALVAPRSANGSISKDGDPSLLSLGFSSIGIDEGWEGCGLGVNGTVHFATACRGAECVAPASVPRRQDLAEVDL